MGDGRRILTRDEIASLGNDDYVGRSVMERLEDRFGKELVLAFRGRLFAREVFGGAADALREVLERGTKAEKTLTRALYVLLEFIVGGLWFLLYASALILNPGYDPI